VNVSCSTDPVLAVGVPITRRQNASGPLLCGLPLTDTADASVPVAAVRIDVPHTLAAPVAGRAANDQLASHPVVELEYDPTVHCSVSVPFCATIGDDGVVVVLV
jgi:hypothetical protein